MKQKLSSLSLSSALRYGMLLMRRCCRSRKMLILFLFLLFLVYVTHNNNMNQINEEYNNNRFVSSSSSSSSLSQTAKTLSSIVDTSTSKLSLGIGELPGYTGWARPSRTYANYFHIIHIDNDNFNNNINDNDNQLQRMINKQSIVIAKTNTIWNITIRCSTPTSNNNNEDICISLYPMFYVRAYGSSIITGTVVPINNKYKFKDYNVTFYFHDVGIYTIEVVLTYSNITDLFLFPLQKHNEQPSLYEGYILPNFPIIVHVIPNKNDENDNNNNKHHDQSISSQTKPYQLNYIWNNMWSSTSLHSSSSKQNKMLQQQQKNHDYYCTVQQLTINHHMKDNTDDNIRTLLSSISQTSNNSNSNSNINNINHHYDSIQNNYYNDIHILKHVRWKIIDYMKYHNHNNDTTNNNDVNNANEKISFDGYQQSYHSIGFRTDYIYTDCILVSINDLKTKTTITTTESILSTTTVNQKDTTSITTNTNNSSSSFQPCIHHLSKTDNDDSDDIPKILHIILIGDSVMRLQKDYFELYYKNIIQEKYNNMSIRITFYELYGGIIKHMIKTTTTTATNQNQTNNDNNNLYNLVKQLNKERTLGMKSEYRIVLYNTGMHDIHRLCDNEYEKEHYLYYKNDTSHNMNCIQLYYNSIKQFNDDIILQLHANVILYQTITAAWPKYGNYGISWDPRYGQKQPFDHHFIYVLNQLAQYIMNESNNKYNDNNTKTNINMIHIMDTYWMTLSRPDHREIDIKTKNMIGKKLSHPGYEIIHVMIRTWIQISFQLLFPSISTSC